MPLTHAQIWNGIDRLARREGLSASGLARRAELDPTSFNPSKRQAADRLRWPSTESLTKVLTACGVSLADFARLAEDAGAEASVPLIGFAAVYLRYKHMPSSILPKGWITLMLWVSAVVMAVILGYSIILRLFG